uniref:C2H2-type domain-containing protein n=1 Tax=Cyclopterus lumpus TaxID=8103 RepID=A0A8C2XF83_CYCLU
MLWLVFLGQDDFGNHSMKGGVSTGTRNESCLTSNNEELRIQNIFPHGVSKSLDCSFCGERFLSREDLIVHRASHTGELPVLCTFCGKSFVNKTTLGIHMRIHTGEKPYACTQCGKRFTQNGSLKIHLRTHSGEKPYTCNQCVKEFDTMFGRDVHIRSHKKCNGCKKEFPFPSALGYHKGTCRKLKKFKASIQKDEPAEKHCVHCNKVFRSSWMLKQHERVHTGERPYLCSVCPKKFRVNQALKKHILRMHKDQTNISETNENHARIKPSEEPEDSGEDLMTPREDTSEAINHNKVKRARNPDPGQSSKWRTMGTHCPDGFVCALCQRVSKNKYLLIEHFRTHTGEKPLKCDQCSAMFRSRGQLSMHKKSCPNPLKVTQCVKCEKKFSCQTKYVNHLSNFHKDRPNCCTFCGKGFFTKGRLRNHMERYHK